MPTEITRSSAPSARRVGTPGPGLRDVKPVSFPAVAISLPALFAGSALGIVAFRNIDEVGFRRTILVLLLMSGASLALA